jgi:hypothetical protein
VCGHSTFSAKPINLCAKATSSRGRGSREASLRQQPATIKAMSTGVTLDLDIESRQERAKPPPQTSLLTGTRSPKGTNTTPMQQRRSSPSSANNAKVEPCREGLIHPLHTVRIETLCPDCAADREERLNALALFSTEIKFDPARWQWKYRGNGEGPLPKRHHVDSKAEHNVAEVEQKVETGSEAWPSTKWIKDWRG